MNYGFKTQYHQNFLIFLWVEIWRWVNDIWEGRRRRDERGVGDLNWEDMQIRDWGEEKSKE